MLPKCLFVKNIRSQVTLPCQWLSITINAIRSSSNSSSSDSSSGSDSDSDGKQKIVKQTVKTTSSTEIDNKDNKFGELINSLLTTTPSKTVDMKINVRGKQEKIERHLAKAADTLTTVVGGDKEKILSTLLESLSNIKKEKPFTKLSNTIAQCKQNIETRYELQSTKNYKDMDVKREKSTKFNNQYKANKTRRFENKYKKRWGENSENDNVTQTTTNAENRYKKNLTQKRGESVIYGLLNERTESSKSKRFDKISETTKYSTIFTQTNIPPPNVPELRTWHKCEESELKVLQSHYPENAFQEMIQWTEEGKLWKFPIDNEQGMEEEQNVHFSEHVFLERHLIGWCPSKGPIRHYMELVCTGLSKNPYMTVQEKYDHIMWYKGYFDSNKDLLKKLGLDDVAPSTAEKQIEAQ